MKKQLLLAAFCCIGALNAMDGAPDSPLAAQMAALLVGGDQTPDAAASPQTPGAPGRAAREAEDARTGSFVRFQANAIAGAEVMTEALSLSAQALRMFIAAHNANLSDKTKERTNEKIAGAADALFFDASVVKQAFAVLQTAFANYSPPAMRSLNLN